MSEYIKKEDTIKYLNDLFGEMYHVSLGNVLQSLDSLQTYSFPDSAENKGDLISRQAVLDELEKWDWQDLYLPIHFKQILDDIPSVESKGEWIPVSERLPENDGQYFVAYDREDEITENISYFDRHGFWIGNVVAWQPLPKPYKKGE